jgi:zinc/manganese transport system permease protein
MNEFLQLMIKPFVACLILTGIHAYLGLHVVERGVIFVDLALAQIAAFGATVGILWGWGLHSTQSYCLALGFTFVGAAVFAMTRHRKPIVPQEALIGITYAVSAAASILVLSRAAEGGEELKALLVGHLLFVEWTEIAKVFFLFFEVCFIGLHSLKQSLTCKEILLYLKLSSENSSKYEKKCQNRCENKKFLLEAMVSTY